ncbi:AraC family transcriptional regulator [Paraburkholderia edwinii]|uniref:AraC family transcriptional regulator n=1 Tax=Paraburkholderia edwinii TaxID=2861782 RepID=A0ABX8UEM9_9BURK|nr:AraC family transcriptional regulator [Paraburkholderia edwinii]QYD67215.1 AraC family transcriptional regulator [Paraburkholderia edwinii]
MEAEPHQPDCIRRQNDVVDIDADRRNSLEIYDTPIGSPEAKSQNTTIRNWPLGPIALTSIDVGNLPMTVGPLSDERFVYLVVSQSGGLTIEANGQILDADVRSAVFIDLEKPHQQHFRRHSRAIALRAPRKVLLERGGLREQRLGLLTRHMSEPDVRAASETIALIGLHSGHTSFELRRRQGEHLLDIFSLITDDPHGRGRPRSASATLSRAKRYISRNFCNVGLNVELIASAVGASEAHLHRLFRAEGHSMMRYVQSHRLELAAQLLTRPGERQLHVKEIAYRCGFMNHAHFSRSFRAYFGVSPRTAATTGMIAQHKRDDRFLSAHDAIKHDVAPRCLSSF